MKIENAIHKDTHLSIQINLLVPFIASRGETALFKVLGGSFVYFFQSHLGLLHVKESVSVSGAEKSER